MRPKLYADAPARRTRQIVVDLVALAWIVLFAVLGVRAHEEIAAYADQVRRADGAGRDLAASLTRAGDFLGGTPLVGEEIRSPFDAAADGARGVAGAGRESAAAVERLGDWVGWAVLVLPVLAAAPYYLPGRVRFVLAASRAARLLARDPDPDLWALRALARQPVELLARTVPGAAARWRAGDPEAVAALAALELDDLGIRRRPRAVGRQR